MRSEAAERAEGQKAARVAAAWARGKQQGLAARGELGHPGAGAREAREPCSPRR